MDSGLVDHTVADSSAEAVSQADEGSASEGAGPSPQTIGGLTYYWIVFASTRSPTTPNREEQLHVAGVTMDDAGDIRTFAPIYLWNQNALSNNLIPTWGTFALPEPSLLPSPPQHPLDEASLDRYHSLSALRRKADEGP